jgi:hypothetical protein
MDKKAQIDEDTIKKIIIIIFIVILLVIAGIVVKYLIT